MNVLRLFPTCLLLCHLDPNHVLAQGTITDGAVSFTRTSSSWDSSPEAHLLGLANPSSVDIVRELGWWYRVEGQPFERPMPMPSSQSYVGSRAEYLWPDIDGQGLFAAEVDEVVLENDPGEIASLAVDSPKGLVVSSLLVTNLSSTQPLHLHLFGVIDADRMPGVFDDSARLAQWQNEQIVEVIDPATSDFFHWVASDAKAYRVDPALAAELSNATTTTFANTGLPFGPGNFVGGYEFELIVPPNDIALVGVVLWVNTRLNCAVHQLPVTGALLCEGFETGDLRLWDQVVP